MLDIKFPLKVNSDCQLVDSENKVLANFAWMNDVDHIYKQTKIANCLCDIINHLCNLTNKSNFYYVDNTKKDTIASVTPIVVINGNGKKGRGRPPKSEQSEYMKKKYGEIK